jgi:hypothetical protein
VPYVGVGPGRGANLPGPAPPNRTCESPRIRLFTSTSQLTFVPSSSPFSGLCVSSAPTRPFWGLTNDTVVKEPAQPDPGAQVRSWAHRGAAMTITGSGLGQVQTLDPSSVSSRAPDRGAGVHPCRVWFGTARAWASYRRGSGRILIRSASNTTIAPTRSDCSTAGRLPSSSETTLLARRSRDRRIRMIEGRCDPRTAMRVPKSVSSDRIIRSSASARTGEVVGRHQADVSCVHRVMTHDFQA